MLSSPMLCIHADKILLSEIVAGQVLEMSGIVAHLGPWLIWLWLVWLWLVWDPDWSGTVTGLTVTGLGPWLVWDHDWSGTVTDLELELVWDCD